MTAAATLQSANMTLRTPEEVSEELGPDKIGPYMIRRLVKERKVACTKLARGRIVFTHAQVEAMLAYLEQPAQAAAAAPVAQVSPFAPTSRSKAAKRRQ
jgi:hypothetical protein